MLTIAAVFWQLNFHFTQQARACGHSPIARSLNGDDHTHANAARAINQHSRASARGPECPAASRSVKIDWRVRVRARVHTHHKSQVAKCDRPSGDARNFLLCRMMQERARFRIILANAGAHCNKQQNGSTDSSFDFNALADC